MFKIMSTNCLVKKFKTVVENPNLKYLGKFNIILNNSYGFQVNKNDNQELTIKADKTFTANGIECTANEEHVFTSDNIRLTPVIADTNFSMTKYGISIIGYTAANQYAELSADVNDIKFLRKGAFFDAFGNITLSELLKYGLEAITLNGNYTLTIDDVTNNTVTDLSLEKSPNVRGSIEDINSNSLIKLRIGYTNIGGNVENMNIPNLTVLSAIENPVIEGDLKVWANKMWNNGSGRISGSCIVNTISQNWTATKLTWDGTPIYAAISGVYAPYIKFSQNAEPILSATSD